MTQPATNIGPLTTTFVPPDDCGLRISESTGVFNADWGLRCRPRGAEGQILVVQLEESCFPDGYGSYINGDNDLFSTLPVFSPGSMCPSGYKPACTIERHEGEDPPWTDGTLTTADFEIWRRLEYDQTAVGCCPSGYACADTAPLACTSHLGQGDVISGSTFQVGCESTMTTGTIKSDQTQPASAHRLLLIQGEGSPVPATDTPTAPSKFEEEDDDDDSGGLSRGRLIVMCVVLGLLALAVAGGFTLCYRRKRRKPQRQAWKMAAEHRARARADPATQWLISNNPTGTLGLDRAAQDPISAPVGIDSVDEAPPSYPEAIELGARPGASSSRDS